jgi:hypothetical protein
LMLFGERVQLKLILWFLHAPTSSEIRANCCLLSISCAIIIYVHHRKSRASAAETEVAD